MPLEQRAAGGEHDVQSSRGQSRSRSGESSPIQSNPKRRRLSDGNAQGCTSGHSPGHESFRQDPRPPFKLVSKPEKDAPHIFDLSYEAYLEYYHKVQSRISALYTSGQLFWSGSMPGAGGGRHPGSNGSQFSMPNGNGMSMGRRGPQGPMSEAQ